MPSPLALIEWHPAFRIVPTRFPSINLFDRVASSADFDALYELESLTNERLRNELGLITLVPPEERLYGAGSGPIMASFTHLNPLGSRFSDGTFGVFYAAREKETAVAETSYHQGRFMRATREEPIQLQMRLYHVEVSGRYEDLRKLPPDDPVLHPDSYAASQSLARERRLAGAAGLAYRSVRASGGQCIAAFKTLTLSNCRHAGQLLYQWDGAAISAVFEQIPPFFA